MHNGRAVQALLFYLVCIIVHFNCFFWFWEAQQARCHAAGFSKKYKRLKHREDANFRHAGKTLFIGTLLYAVIALGKLLVSNFDVRHRPISTSLIFIEILHMTKFMNHYSFWKLNLMRKRLIPLNQTKLLHLPKNKAAPPTPHHQSKPTILCNPIRAFMLKNMALNKAKTRTIRTACQQKSGMSNEKPLTIILRLTVFTSHIQGIKLEETESRAACI